MATESNVQAFIHKLEEGGWAKWIQTAVIVAIVVAVSVYLVISRFNGLSSSTGMEQAQIAREVARGHGFSTKMIRPVEIKPLIEKQGTFPIEGIPETFHGPLFPVFNAVLFQYVGDDWKMPESDLVYLPDRLVAIGAMICFAAGLGLNFLTLKRLFDSKLAVLTTGLCIVSSTFWKMSLTGLPQMLLFLLFAGAMYFLIRAVQNQTEGRRTTGWLALAGGFFGLMALTHALALWIFGGAVIFAALFFRPKLRDTAVMAVVFLIVYSPWLVRNQAVSGSPFGSSLYTVMGEANGDQDALLRSPSVTLRALSLGGLRVKVQSQTVAQLDGIYGHLGHILVAPFFFLSLIHLFKRADTSYLRWGLLLMWLGAVAGMSLFGVNAGDTGVNNLHLLFIPFMTAYGLAFVLVLWNRLGIHLPLARAVLLTMIFMVSAAPFVFYLLEGRSFPVQWPPYVAPYIGKLNDWVEPNEVIASDMPWATAWYADRISLWLPRTPAELVRIHDWRELQAPVAGLYLSPLTGDRKFISEIAKGEWKEWAPLVMRTTAFPAGWPFRSVLPMPVNNESVFYADSERWKADGDGN